MTNYTQYGKNVIFCGPAQMLDQPIRKESPVAAQVLRGTVVHLVAGEFAAGQGDLGYVLDRDHLGHEFVDVPYDAGARATAFWPQSGLVLNVLADAGQEIAEDDPLFVGSAGTLTATAPTPGEGEPAAVPYGYAAETITTGDAPELVAVKFV